MNASEVGLCLWRTVHEAAKDSTVTVVPSLHPSAFSIEVVEPFSTVSWNPSYDLYHTAKTFLVDLNDAIDNLNQDLSDNGLALASPSKPSGFFDISNIESYPVYEGEGAQQMSVKFVASLRLESIPSQVNAPAPKDFEVLYGSGDGIEYDYSMFEKKQVGFISVYLVPVIVNGQSTQQWAHLFGPPLEAYKKEDNQVLFVFDSNDYYSQPYKAKSHAVVSLAWQIGGQTDSNEEE